MSFPPCPPGTWQSPHPLEVPPASRNGLSPRPWRVQEELECQIPTPFYFKPLQSCFKISLLQAANLPCIPNPPLLMLYLCLALIARAGSSSKSFGSFIATSKFSCQPRKVTFRLQTEGG